MTERNTEALSALLDGELRPADAARMRAEIASDALLRAEYDQLAALDTQLRELAEEAGFQPVIVLPTARASVASGWSWPAIGAAVVALMLVRFLPKVLDLAVLGVGMHVLAVAAVCGFVMKFAREDPVRLASAKGNGQ